MAAVMVSAREKVDADDVIAAAAAAAAAAACITW